MTHTTGFHTTGLKPPYGWIKRSSWSLGSPHVTAGIDWSRPRRKPTHRWQTFTGFSHWGEPRHYWFHRCKFLDGLMFGQSVLSALITNCKFIGGHTGLSLGTKWRYRIGPPACTTTSEKPRGPVVVDGCSFKGQTGYGIYGIAPVAVLNSVFRGPGGSTYHGIRLIGGSDAAIMACDVAVQLAIHSLSVRDSGRSGGRPDDWRIINPGTEHVTISGCRRRWVWSRGGPRLRRGLHHTLQLGPQNRNAGLAGAFGARYVDVVGNDIRAQGPQRWAGQVDGPASDIIWERNRLWTWDEGATPIIQPDGSLLYDYNHISERHGPTNVTRTRNEYLGLGEP